MARRKQIYQGKAKDLYEGPEPGTLVQYFKDDATAFGDRKKGTIAGKGVLNNRISEHLLTRLGDIGIPTQFVRRLNMREQLVREVEMIPVKVMVRNVAAADMAQRFPARVAAFRQLDVALVNMPLTAIGAALAQPAKNRSKNGFRGHGGHLLRFRLGL